MNQKHIILIIFIVGIVGLIAYFEQGKVSIEEPTVVLNGDVDVRSEETSSAAEKAIASKYKKAPELTGIVGYINVEEGVKISDFRGKVVLIDFWTYTCINCIRTLPFLTDWHAKYADKGLVIIGVHTPEFEFEKEYDNVVAAMEKHGVEYRVVQDNNYATWRAFRNRFWPRKYLIDKDGFIRYDHIGEGAYKTTEKMIQKLLAEIGEDVTEMEPSLIEEKTPRRLMTPELYAGYDFALPRGQNVGNPGGLQAGDIATYTLPNVIAPDVIYLEGTWKSNADDFEAIEDGAIVLNFLAQSVNFVADGGLTVKVTINDEPVNTDDVLDGVLTIDEPRLYNVYSGEYGRFTLRLEVESGFKVNAFTFG